MFECLKKLKLCQEYRNMKFYKKIALLIVLGVIAGFSYLGYQGLFRHDDHLNTSDHNPLSSSKQKQNSIEVVGNPESIAVLVNKQNLLPDHYEPADLVYPDVRFIFKEKIEKRQMRTEAAKALERMFSVAEREGIYLAGVSAYRSQIRQESLYQAYLKQDGEAAASHYSAHPGSSEHQTGLSIDVSSSTGKCAAQDCFKDTPEAKWIERNSYKYGYIVRYPEGKQQITGYKYEPWHIRFVGKELASKVYKKGITLEEYYNDYMQVDNPVQ